MEFAKLEWRGAWLVGVSETEERLLFRCANRWWASHVESHTPSWLPEKLTGRAVTQAVGRFVVKQQEKGRDKQNLVCTRLEEYRIANMIRKEVGRDA